MAVQAERLAELVAAGEAGLAAGLPRQLTTATSGMAERARIDDVALTLCYADTELGQTPSGDRNAAPQPLVRAYVSGLDVPLTATEQQALPWAIARQPLWGIGGWVAVLDAPDTAWAHARATFPAVPPTGRRHRHLADQADLARAEHPVINRAETVPAHNERCAEPITAALVATAIRARPPASRGHSTRAAASLR